MVVVQTEERNMYDQHWLCVELKERYPLYFLYEVFLGNSASLSNYLGLKILQSEVSYNTYQE